MLNVTTTGDAAGRQLGQTISADGHSQTCRVLAPVLSLVLAVGCLMLALPRTAEANCNAANGYCFDIDSLDITPLTSMVCTGTPVTLTATATLEGDGVAAAETTYTWTLPAGASIVVPQKDDLTTSTLVLSFVTPGLNLQVKCHVEGTNLDPNRTGCSVDANASVTVVKTTLGSIDHVCTKGPHASHNVLVTVEPAGVAATLSIAGPGSATVTPSSVSGSQTVVIQGVTASGGLNDMTLTTTVPGLSGCSASQSFTIYDVDTLTAAEDLHPNNSAAGGDLFICEKDDGTSVLNPISLTWLPVSVNASSFKWTLGGSAWTPNSGDFSAPAPIESEWTHDASQRIEPLTAWFDCDASGVFASNYPNRQINVNVVDLDIFKLSSTNCPDMSPVTSATRDTEDAPPAHDDAAVLDLMQKFPGQAPVPMQMDLSWAPTNAPAARMMWSICDKGTETPSTQWDPRTGTFESTPVMTQWTQGSGDPASVNREYDVRAWYDCNDNHEFSFAEQEPRRLLYADVAFFEHIQVLNDAGKETLNCPLGSIRSEGLMTRKPDSGPQNRVMNWKNVINTEYGAFEANAQSTDSTCPFKPPQESLFPPKMVQLEVTDSKHDCVREVARIHTGCQCSSCKFGSELECGLRSDYYFAINLGDCVLWFIAQARPDGSIASVSNLKWPRERWVDGNLVDYQWTSPAGYNMKIKTDGKGNVTEFSNNYGSVTVTPVDGGFVLICTPNGSGTPNVIWGAFDSGDGQSAIAEAITDPATVTNLFSKTQQEDTTVLTRNQGGGTRIEKVESTPAGDHTNRVRTIQDGQGNVVSVTQETWQDLGWGEVMTAQVVDPAGAALTTTWTYYTNAAETGRFTRLSSVLNADGSWARYDYNLNGQQTLVVSGFQDTPPGTPASQSRATFYDYTPLVAEPAGIYPQTPRTVVETIQGITNSVTFHAFSNNPNNALVEIVERASSAAAAFGDASNLRTITTYNPNLSANTAEIGKVQAEQTPDGLLNRYTYESGFYTTNGTPGGFLFTPNATGSFVRITATHGTVASPDGIAGKTTRDVTIQDNLDRTLASQILAYTGAGYEQIGWTQYRLDVNGHQLDAWRSNGAHSEKTWECCGVATEMDETGVEQDHVYDEILRPVISIKRGAAGTSDIITASVLDAAGHTLIQTVSSGGWVLTTSNVFDTAGRQIATVDAAGLVTTYAYPDPLTSVTVSPGGLLTNTTIRFADGQTKCTIQNGVIQSWNDYGANPDGTSWNKSWTGPAGSNSPMWQKTTTDLLGHTVKTERPGFGAVVLTNQSFYNNIGQLVRSTAPGQADTLMQYDELGNQFRSGLDVNGNGALNLASLDRISESQTWYEKDASNNWWQASSAILYAGDNSAVPTTNSVQKTLLYASSPSYASYQSFSVSQDILGNQTLSMTAVDRPNKTTAQTTIYPDSTNAAVSVSVNGLAQYSISKTGVFTTNAFDALGRQISVQQGTPGMLRTGSFTHYNSLGQVDWTADMLSNRTTYGYSQTTGQRVSVMDALSNSTYTAYDPPGRVIATWGATYPVGYTFDAYGRMVAMQTWRDTNGLPDVTQWLYDEATGLLTNKFYADNNGPAYTYTPESRLSMRTWARGVVTTYSYSPLTGEMTNIIYAGTTPAVSFTFNRLGQPATVKDGTGTRGFSYNAALQLVAETNAIGVFQRGYDALGRPAEFSLGDDYLVQYGYASDGRFGSVSSTVASASSVVNYSYLPGTDLIAGWSNNAGFAVARAYEPKREVMASVQNSFGLNAISRFDYANDALARRTGRVDNTAMTNVFRYNPRSELIAAAMGTNRYGYVYDPIGNRMVATNNAEALAYVANGLNQYTSIQGDNTLTPTYDADGNMTQCGTWTFTWDGENRLISATDGSTVVTNCYDYMSRRIAKTVNGSPRQFIYDGWAMVRETAGAMTNSYVYGLDLSGSMQGAGTIGGILCASMNGVQAFYFYDANGNVTDLAGASGNSLAHYEYDPYGNITQQGGSAPEANPFRFSSKYLDEETGLYYYGYRFYSPVLGRWVNRDLIGERGGMLYSAVGNSPECSIDILGAMIADMPVEFTPSIGVRTWNVLFNGVLSISLGMDRTSHDITLSSSVYLSVSPGSEDEWHSMIKSYWKSFAHDYAIGSGHRDADLINRRLGDWAPRNPPAGFTPPLPPSPNFDDTLSLALSSSANPNVFAWGYKWWNTAVLRVSRVRGGRAPITLGWTRTWSGIGLRAHTPDVIGKMSRSCGSGRLRAEVFYAPENGQRQPSYYTQGLMGAVVFDWWVEGEDVGNLSVVDIEGPSAYTRDLLEFRDSEFESEDQPNYDLDPM